MINSVGSVASSPAKMLLGRLIPISANKEKTIIAFLETAAQVIGVSPERAYTLDGLVEEIYNIYNDCETIKLNIDNFHLDKKSTVKTMAQELYKESGHLFLPIAAVALPREFIAACLIAALPKNRPNDETVFK